MSRVAIDTSAYSALFRKHPGIVEAMRQTEVVLLSPVVIGELRAGFRRGLREDFNETRLAEFRSIHRVRVPEIDEETADYYAEIRQYLKRAGTPLPTNDIWIAATAMQHGCRVLTTDRHFLLAPQVITDYFEPE
jgi:tRNA(fMet)-specific endonuclease VapC